MVMYKFILNYIVNAVFTVLKPYNTIFDKDDFCHWKSGLHTPYIGAAYDVLAYQKKEYTLSFFLLTWKDFHPCLVISFSLNLLLTSHVCVN